MRPLRPIDAPAPRIPLRHRLPNAPPARQPEAGAVQRAAAAIERTAVTVVVGPRPARNQLALTTLHSCFVDRVDDVVCVDLVGLSPEAAVERVVEVLARSVGAVLGGVPPDYDELVASAIDLAESFPFWLLVDIDEASRELVELVARYARNSRWLVLSDAAWDDPYLQGQHVEAPAVAVVPAGHETTGPDVASDDIDAVCIALEQLVRDERWDELLAAFDAHGSRWLSHFSARRIWEVVAPVSEGRLLAWRLRIAGALGEVVRLRRRPEDETARYWYAVMLGNHGDTEAARAAAETLTHAPTFPELQKLLAELDMRAGRPRRALEYLDEGPDEPDVVRASMRAACLAQLDRTEEAAELAERLLETGAEEDSTAGIWLARALMLVSQPKAAGELLGRLDARFGEAALDLTHGRRLRAMRMRLALYRGALEEARSRLERLEPFGRDNPAFAASLGLARATLRLLTGENDGLEVDLGELLVEAAEHGLQDHYWVAHTHLLQLQNQTGMEFARPSIAEEPAPPSPLYAAFIALYEAEGRLRRGLSREPSSLDDSIDFAVAVTKNRFDLRVAAVEGTPVDVVVADARLFMQRTRDAGFHEAAARHLEALTDLLAVATGDASREATELLGMANAMPSGRFRGHARLHLAAAERRPEILEQIAANTTSPVATRRARWLLGLDIDLDRIDEAVVEALVRHGVPRAQALDEQPVGWGFDPRRKLVWDGQDSYDISSSPTQCAVLEVLVEDRGEADKETLIRRAWGIEEYHPLKHDNRLRQTVRKLRKLIEPDPGEPCRVVTSEEGYRLGPGFRWMP